MKIGVAKEAAKGEKRVAIVADSIKRLAAKKIEVAVEKGAGAESFVSDAEYTAAGAKIEDSRDALIASCDALLQIRVPTLEQIAKLKEGQLFISLLYPLVNEPLVKAFAERKV